MSISKKLEIIYHNGQPDGIRSIRRNLSDLLECGYPGPEGPVLRQREVNSSEAVRAAFETVYRQKGTDFPGFSDLSDALGQD